MRRRCITTGRAQLKHRAWTLAAAAAVLLVSALPRDMPAQAAVEPDPKTDTPPMKLATLDYDPALGRVWISARLNGLGSRSFLVDTGYDLTMIHPDLADQLALETAGQVWIQGIAGRERATYYRGARLDFQGLEFLPRRVASLPSERERRRPRDGILGSGFFRRFVVEVDPGAGKVRLHEPGTYVYSGAGEVFPFQFAGDTPVVEATISGPDGKQSKAKYEIDTGCEGGLCLGRDYVKANDWLLPEGEPRESFRRGVGGGVRTVSGSVPHLHLGKTRIDGLSAEFFAEGSPAGPGMAGHIGWEAFGQFKVIFDYTRSRLMLEAVKQP